MVGKHPREYTNVSKMKLATILMQRLLAKNPSLAPEDAARMANEMVRKHAFKHGTASRIYHEIKMIVQEELGITGQDLAKVRALCQKVVADVLRKYESLKKPLPAEELAPIVDDAVTRAKVMLRMSDEQARRVVGLILERLAPYVEVTAVEEVERAVAGGGVPGLGGE